MRHLSSAPRKKGVLTLRPATTSPESVKPVKHQLPTCTNVLHWVCLSSASRKGYASAAACNHISRGCKACATARATRSNSYGALGLFVHRASCTGFTPSGDMLHNKQVSLIKTKASWPDRCCLLILDWTDSVLSHLSCARCGISFVQYYLCSLSCAVSFMLFHSSC